MNPIKRIPQNQFDQLKEITQTKKGWITPQLTIVPSSAAKQLISGK